LLIFAELFKMKGRAFFETQCIYNTYIAPKVAYCSCSGAFVSQTEQAES